jgi:hypothetical protein
MRLLQLWADHATGFETRVSFGDRPSLDLRMPKTLNNVSIGWTVTTRLKPHLQSVVCPACTGLHINRKTGKLLGQGEK